MDARTESLLQAGYDPAHGHDGYVFSGAALAAIKAHPRFDEAWRRAAVSAIKQYSGSRLLNGLINDRGRSAVALLSLYLHRSARPGDARSGLTVSRLKAICADQGIASPGRIEALLVLMRAAGLLKPIPSLSDQRVRRLEPTERLVATLHERWDGLIEAMALIFPEAEAVRAAISDAAFESALVQRLGLYFLTGHRLMDDPETAVVFAERNGGMMVAFSLATSGDAARETPVTVSISALARQFSVSRVHVRKMLRDAAAAGHIAYPEARETEIVVLPPLYEAVQNFFARAFLGMRRCANEAFDEVAAARARDVARAG